MKYEFFADMKHGWLKVRYAKLVELGIHESISPYSYRRGEYAYLEQDRDARLFVDAIGGKIEYKIKESNYSKIRSYHHYFVG